MKRIFVLCLITVLLLSVFVGCEQTNANLNDTLSEIGPEGDKTHDEKTDDIMENTESGSLEETNTSESTSSSDCETNSSENPLEPNQECENTREEETDEASQTESENLTESVLPDNIISFSQKYKDVLIEYEVLLDAYIDMVTKADNKENINSSDYDKLPGEVFDWLTAFVSQHNSFGKAYAVKDLNGDGKDELIILDGASSSHHIYAVFTITEGNITPIIMSVIPNEYVESIAIAEDGRIYRAVMLKCESYYREIITLMSDGEISLFAYSYEDYRDYFGYDCEVERYKILNGEQVEISAEELSDIESEYAYEFSNMSKLTANTGIKINYFFEFNPK